MPEVAAEPMSPGDQGALALSAFLTTKSAGLGAQHSDGLTAAAGVRPGLFRADAV
jgi:hypothetical protein